MHVVLVGPEFEENLSLRYLAASLQAAGHTASLARFDAPENIEGVVRQVMSVAPALVGLSMVFQVRAREFCALAGALREAGYAGHITAGGHFATFACEALLRDFPAINSIVRQEGEEALVELAHALRDDLPPESLAGIPGLVVRNERGEVLTAPARNQPNLSKLPYPVRSATPEIHLGVPTSYLVGSRGCYADCEYCCIFAWHEAAVGKRYRMRTVSDIATEMEQLYHERGIRFFVFHDDNFFLPTAAGNRKRFEAFRAELRARKLDDIGLMLKLRPNDCDRENMLILKEIGLLRAFVGIENASQRQMRSLGRDSTVEDVQSCLLLLRELDIYATYNILLFDPYTTLDDVEINLDFLRRNLYFPFNWCKVEPYAGTALEQRYAREGRLRGDYFGYDYMMDDPRAAAVRSATARFLLPQLRLLRPGESEYRAGLPPATAEPLLSAPPHTRPASPRAGADRGHQRGCAGADGGSLRVCACCGSARQGRDRTVQRPIAAGVLSAAATPWGAGGGSVAADRARGRSEPGAGRGGVIRVRAARQEQGKRGVGRRSGIRGYRGGGGRQTAGAPCGPGHK